MNRASRIRNSGWEKHQLAAVGAARAAGQLIHANLHLAKKVNAETSHDIKLELDVRCQKLIAHRLQRAFPKTGFLGEEGSAGIPNADSRWVVDPIDGTVNFAHGIPHASVSIALQIKSAGSKVQSPKSKVQSLVKIDGGRITEYETILGVIYDPFTDELWTAVRGQAALLNGRPIRVSRIRRLNQAIVSIGFAKSRSSLEGALPYFIWLARRVRKIRMMGSAALALAYVATGRFDAYIERGISIWDIAAGGLLLECAGGRFWHEPVRGEHKYRMIATNKFLHPQLTKPV